MANLNYSLQGEPPSWYKDAQCYYVNVHNEQWIAVIQDNNVIIAGFDIGWKEITFSPQQAKEAYQIITGKKIKDEEYKKNPLSNWVFNEGEVLWIASVLCVAIEKFMFKKLL